MKFTLLLGLVILLCSCTQAAVPRTEVSQANWPYNQADLQNKELELVSGKQFSSDCSIEKESFNETLSLWLISDLIKVESVIKQDLTEDGIEEAIALLRPTEELQEFCDSPILDEVILLITDSETNETSSTKLSLEYASVPKLYKTTSGFYLEYQIGQSIKCDDRIEFTFEDNNLYINNVKTICYTSSSDIGWQEQSFKNALISPDKVDFLEILDKLREPYF